AVYDYYSTGAFRAPDYFTHARSGTPNHGFGGHIGGPVYLPKIYDGRNKTFFLSSYETTFAPQGADNLTPTVPLAAWEQGNFSYRRRSGTRSPTAHLSRTTPFPPTGSATWPSSIWDSGRTPTTATPTRLPPRTTGLWLAARSQNPTTPSFASITVSPTRTPY